MQELEQGFCKFKPTMFLVPNTCLKIYLYFTVARSDPHTTAIIKLNCGTEKVFVKRTLPYNYTYYLL